ncbi:tRNA/rRNA methyltransferase SpoU family protein [Prunus dulcis]|uniref:tRNA/rRNA methyltransferase SpoU family protein n=1 Tax=Prunus dulcis TaxID=3755 RepID=A0A5H2XIX6_PRUDU|nr:tRNA/rRNA methyltransferase SpoU family protein [Prunus dulcis]
MAIVISGSWSCSIHGLAPNHCKMSACKTLVRTSLSSISSSLRASGPPIPLLHSPSLRFSPLLSPNQGLRLASHNVPSRPYASISTEAVDFTDEAQFTDSTLEPPEIPKQDTVEQLLKQKNDVGRLMKMERSPESAHQRGGRWFPYLDKFSCGEDAYLNSAEVLDALDPYILDVRKERFRRVVKNRSYSCVWWSKGWAISATSRPHSGPPMRSGFSRFMCFRATAPKGATAFEKRLDLVSGIETIAMSVWKQRKWLDIELWDSTPECFEVLKSRGYRIATTHVGMDAVSVYDMDWSCPTAIVVGNENRGISDEALDLSDLHCSIPMKGMVDSFNVSVAAGILMHHAVCDRTSRLGCHGDLTFEESQILLAEFSLRHSKSSMSIAHEYAKRKAAVLTPRI